jgi:hypothetical protein
MGDQAVSANCIVEQAPVTREVGECLGVLNGGNRVELAR